MTHEVMTMNSDDDVRQKTGSTYGMTDKYTSGISRFLSCPECDSDDISWRLNNGRLVLSCEDCLETTSKLVRRATFR